MDEQEAGVEFVRMMKTLQAELDELTAKLGAIHGCAARAALHCDEHAGNLPDNGTSQLKPALSGMAETLRGLDVTLRPATDSITYTINGFGRCVRDMELSVRKGFH